MATPEPETLQDFTSPTVFKSRLGDPDVRFTIFGIHEIHAHSWILKEHSHLLFDFLGSSNKPATSQATEASGAFRYEWITKVDDDGEGWRILQLDRRGREVSTGELVIIWEHWEAYQVNREVNMIKNIFKAFYQQDLMINNSDDLIHLTDLADFFCCLPVVSRALDATMSRASDTSFMRRILPRDAAEILECAGRLRNVSLFKDCIILCCQPWTRPIFKYNILAEGKYDCLLKKVNHAMAVKAKEMHSGLITMIADMERDGVQRAQAKIAWLRYMRKAAAESVDENGTFYPPWYFRSLQIYGGNSFCVTRELKDCLVNRLQLNKEAVAGRSDFGDYLLFGQVDDSDIPWDVNDTSMDW